MKDTSIRCSIALFAFGCVLGADWPQYRGPDRDGVSRETDLAQEWPANGPPLLWTFEMAGLGYSGPAIVGDRLYLAGARDDSEYLIALELSSEGTAAPQERWAVRIGPTFTWRGNAWNAGPNATPTVDGDLVYALGGFGDLICVEAETGEERWRVNLPKDLGGAVNPIGGGLDEPTPLGWGYASAPLVDGDHLICVPGGKQGLMAALDKRTGELRWQSGDITDQASYSSPVVAELGGVRQYIQVINRGIVSVRAEDGDVLWTYERDEPYDDVVIATPIVAEQFVYSSVGFGQGCDLIRVQPRNSGFGVDVIVSNRQVQSRDGGMVRIGGHLFGYSESGGWVCQDIGTGEVLWSDRESFGRGSVMAADGRLYCCAERGGEVALVEPSELGWVEKGRFMLPQESRQRRPSGGLWTHPVIADSRLYIRDQELLFCFDVHE